MKRLYWMARSIKNNALYTEGGEVWRGFGRWHLVTLYMTPKWCRRLRFRLMLWTTRGHDCGCRTRGSKQPVHCADHFREWIEDRLAKEQP